MRATYAEASLWMTLLFPELAVELAEVVVGVEVAPAEPVAGGHSAEVRVRRAGIRWICAEFVEGGEEGGVVLGEVDGGLAVLVLSNFGWGGKAVGPRAGDAEGGEFEDGTWEGQLAWGEGFAAEGAVESLRHVTDHLMDGHGSPEGAVGGREGRQSRVEGALEDGIGQGLHSQGPGTRLQVTGCGLQEPESGCRVSVGAGDCVLSC